MTQYTYSISGDITAGICDTPRLESEIRASQIATSLNHIDTGGDILNIWFNATLSNDDETLLDGLVLNHTGEPLVDASIQTVTISSNDKDTVGNLLVKPRPVDGTLHIDYLYMNVGCSGDLADLGGCPEYTIACSSGVCEIRYEPTYSYYVDGGGFKVMSSATSGDVKVKVTIAPEIPAEYGGSKVIVNNKKLIPHEQFDLAVPPKYVGYISGMPANVIQILFTHQDPEDTEVEMYLRVYK